MFYMSNKSLGCLHHEPFHTLSHSPLEAISACEKAEKWQHALALLADLASRPSSDLEDHPRTRKWLLTMVIISPLRIGLFPFQMA